MLLHVCAVFFYLVCMVASCYILHITYFTYQVEKKTKFNLSISFSPSSFTLPSLVAVYCPHNYCGSCVDFMFICYVNKIW